jgi:general secretion pathway protein I
MKQQRDKQGWTHQRGFTLIEALVALMIAATALVVLMGSLGTSADIQHSLSLHDLAMEQAQNKLTELSLQATALDEQHGSMEVADIQLQWRSWSEKTMMDGFVRVNVSIQAPGEPDVTLFLYRTTP